ncbi:SIS domain-containing protein [Nonomuraea sp. MG754425]|uniref:MurR/RpiR family transcriptional regulator n=1 Tax=Nonomuraea sp. MG754425 TaxID=2570319 RepID=UPI001F33E8F5|nr:SIS domain-containing protein [Nonomuraea sp. MG754425]MCF6474014.1 SIS domain-containing protein [Nonomuraea sp. MG754425]
MVEPSGRGAPGHAAPVGPGGLDALRATARAIRSARRTVVVGSGDGAGPAQALGRLGPVLGHDVRLALGSSTAQAVHISQLQAGDCLVVLGVRPPARGLRGLTRLGRERGATVCVLTEPRSSRLAEDAHHVVVTPVEGFRDGPSRTAMAAAVQGILAELAGTDPAHAFGAVRQVWDDLGVVDDRP